MDSIELMSKFIDGYVTDDRKDRWQELAKKKGAIYKKLAQLERHLANGCIHVAWTNDELLLEFIKRFKPVWLWDFHPDKPIRLIHPEDVLAQVNTRSAFLAISEVSANAIYFNGDTDGWLCGGWRPLSER